MNYMYRNVLYLLNAYFQINTFNEIYIEMFEKITNLLCKFLNNFLIYKPSPSE